MKLPDKIPFTKVGMRVVKSALAVGVCLAVQLVTGSVMQFAPVAAVMSMQQSPDKTLAAGVNRLIGTVFGGAVGFLVLRLAEYIPYYTEFWYVVIIPLGLVLVSWLCLGIKRPSGVALSCVVYLALATNFGRTITDTGLYVLVRLAETAFGVLVALGVDTFIYPMRPEPHPEEAPEQAGWETDPPGK